jgi:glycosyltransferase involved in cell wall biosynthesis
MPSVTVIIPSYNHAAFLPDCLNSIINQSFTDWQVILIDDGSTDYSVEVAQTFAQQDPRIQVHINPKNLGTYGTQARALNLTESPYVAVMNSDDFWAPEKLSKQITQLENHPDIALSYVLGWLVQNATPDITNDVHQSWPTSGVQNPLPFLVFENRILASGVLWRREFARFETTCRYSGDWVALLEAACQAPFGCINERLTFWRQHETNSYRISPKQAAEELRVRLAILNQHQEILTHADQPELIKRGLDQNLINLTSLYAYFNQSKQARKVLLGNPNLIANKPRAAKRLLGTFLGAELFRAHVLRDLQSDATTDQLDSAFAAIEPLKLQIKKK